MHILQKQILDALRRSPELRYSELQPREIESSHFTYHLSQLVKDGLVEQVSRGTYQLTAKGIASVDRLSEGRVNPHVSPKVITYTLLQDATHYYVQQKTKEPYRGLVNMIGGKQHLGETNLAAAQRELIEKTGLCIGELSYCGVATVRILQAGLLVSHSTAHIFCGDMPAATDLAKAGLVAVAKDGINSLASSASLTAPAPDLLPIVAAIEAGHFPFVIELELSL